jgi:signal transduction histidine kinase
VTAGRRDRLRLGLVVAALWIGLGVVLHAGIERRVEAGRPDAEERVLRDARAAADAARQMALRTLDAVATLHALGEVALAEGPRGAGDLSEVRILGFLRRFAAEGRAGVFAVRLVSPEGQVLWSSRLARGGAAASEAPVPEPLRTHPDRHPTAAIGDPAPDGPAGRLGVQVTRPVVRADGGLAGIVVVSLDPAALATAMRGLVSLESGVAAVIRHDGMLLAGSAAAPGGIAALPAGLVAAVAGQAEGSARLPFPDGTERLAAWAPLPGYPVSVLVGFPLAEVEEALAGTRVVLRLAGFGALVLGAVGMLLVVVLLARARTAAEARLADRSRRELAAIVDALPGAIYRGVLGPDGYPAATTETIGIERLLGRDAASMSVPGGLSALMDPDVAASRRAVVNTVLDGGEDAVAEYRLRHGSGGHIWVRDHLRLFRRRADGGAEVVGLLIDITAERALKAQAATAARLATLGEMAAGVAHELNQPGAAIAMAADVAALELARGDPASISSAAGRLGDIAAQTSRMRAVIDHFRRFARADPGPVELLRIPELVQGALAICGGMLRAAGIRVVLDVPADLPPVRGGAIALEQVLVNLLANARDAMEAAPAALREIEIRAAVAAGGSAVELRVADRGCGIDEATADRLFEPFFTTKPAGRGTGLGLAIAYGTVTALGGSIRLVPRDGGGAEACIRLPAAAAAEPARAAAE